MAVGKYGRKDSSRPIYNCDSKDRFTSCIILQETDESYLLRRRKRSDIMGEMRFSEAVWRRKRTVKLLNKIGEVIYDNYTFKWFDPKVTVKEIRGKCPRCKQFYEISRFNRRHFYYWLCPSCKGMSRSDQFEVAYILEIESEVIEEKKPILTNDCPICGFSENEVKDKKNNIILCESCGIYYIAGYPPEE